tara:strand:- start:10595 stop:11509 length:915 start_codon:yes stop_codon:yes gene_type:complete
MAFGITAYAEAAIASEANDIIAYPQGNTLTASLGNSGTPGTANVPVTGSQATISTGQVISGTSALVNVTTAGQLTTSIGEEGIDIGVPLTGIEMSISNKKLSQDTLTAFAQAPFATQSPDTIEVPIVEVATTTGGEIGAFQLNMTFGTFSVSADGNVSVVVSEHTLNTAIGSTSVVGIGNVPVTGIQMTSSIGSESAFTDHTVAVSGQQLTMSMGEEGTAGNATIAVTGIQMASSIGTASQATKYDVSGQQMATSAGSVSVTGTAVVIPTGIQLQTNTGNPIITAWQEINPGVTNVWTEVDLAA